METVAFYSYKGGVGRSLLLVNTARFLALSGRRVVALDLDFEAPGLHYKLGVHDRVESGALDLLLRSLDGELPTQDDIRRSCIDVHLPAPHGAWLRLLAAGSAPSRDYWSQLGKLNGRLGASQDVGLLEAMLDLQDRIHQAHSPDVLLVDARTGVTSLGGIATMAMAERVVLVTTPARESLDGVLAVEQSLRETPLLRGGERNLKFVVSRVQGTEALKQQELRGMLGDYVELPNDPLDGGAERMLGSGTFPQPGRVSFARAVQHSLLARTLEWIQTAFPAEAKAAARAQQRMMEVEGIWNELTAMHERVGGWIVGRDYWNLQALTTDVRVVGSDGSVRTADIMAKLDDGALAMVIEYVDDGSHEDLARWWAGHTSARVVVAVLPRDSNNNAKRKVYSVDGQQARLSKRWDPPGPKEFSLLDDPTDLSIENLLRANNDDRYRRRLVAKWVRTVAVGLHGDGPWDPVRARKILDGFAAVEGADAGAIVLWSCSRGSSDREMWIHGADDYLDRLVHEGLCAPLCWRVDPRAFVQASRDHRHGPPPAFHGLARLARFMGLTYDPDAVFRREAPKLVGNGDIYPVRDLFKSRELEFEWSEQPLERVSLPRDMPEPTLGYHGHLGTYTPATGRVVLAGPTIEQVANSIARAPRYVGSVALLHLSVLGLLHNGIDLDERRWEGFSLGDPSPWPGDIPPATVVLAQFFVHAFLVELADANLKDAFEALTDQQGPAYRAWRMMGHVSLEAARAWMMAIRRGTGAVAPVDLDALLRSA